MGTRVPRRHTGIPVSARAPLKRGGRRTASATQRDRAPELVERGRPWDTQTSMWGSMFICVVDRQEWVNK